jgi:excisionase family DNA binding protein
LATRDIGKASTCRVARGMPKLQETPNPAKGHAVSARPKRAAERAFSTGQAARFCYVTSDTILNWIRSNRLPAQRTAGGQHRIRLDDLRSFMLENGMGTGLLDAEKDVRPYCWEFHCHVTGRHSTQAAMGPCAECLVRRSGTLNCWELHGLLSATRRRVDACEDCDYYANWRRAGAEDT